MTRGSGAAAIHPPLQLSEAPDQRSAPTSPVDAAITPALDVPGQVGHPPQQTPTIRNLSRPTPSRAFARVRGAMDSGSNPWQLEKFESGLDAWISLETPDDDMRLVVTAWVLTRFDDPYQGVRRERGFPNLWFGSIPGSDHAGLNCYVLLLDLRQCTSRAVQQLCHAESPALASGPTADNSVASAGRDRREPITIQYTCNIREMHDTCMAKVRTKHRDRERLRPGDHDVPRNSREDRSRRHGPSAPRLASPMMR